MTTGKLLKHTIYLSAFIYLYRTSSTLLVCHVLRLEHGFGVVLIIYKYGMFQGVSWSHLGLHCSPKQ